MSAAEIVFEKLAGVLEGTRGTLVTPPDHAINSAGTLVPKRERHVSSDRYGILAKSTRSQTIRTSGEVSGDSDADTTLLPWWMNLGVKGGVTTPATPSGATLSRLWTFLRTMTADDLASATTYWGDPGMHIWQMAYTMLQEWSLSADASGTGVAAFKFKGVGHYPLEVSTPTFPALAPGALLVPAGMQLWIDTSSAIGTTAITGRVISGDLTVPTGVKPKWMAVGPSATTYDWVKVGREPVSPTLKLRFELSDLTQFDQFDQDTNLKIRWRVNGPKIETVTAVDFYYYFECDLYGKFGDPTWGVLEGTNRTIDMTVMGEYNVGIGSDLIVRVQNASASL